MTDDIKAIRDALGADHPREEIDLAAVARLLDALELAQKDAERYRWLLLNSGPWHAWAVRETGENSLNAAIDAAMKGQE